MRSKYLLHAKNTPHQQRHSHTESERMTIPCKWNPKQTGITVLTSSKADFKIKFVRRDKGHYKLGKGTIYQEDTMIANIYALNVAEFHKTNTTQNKGTEAPYKNSDFNT